MATKAVVPKPKAIIIDFGGIVCPQNFFGDRMRPYVMANLKRFIAENWQSSAFQEVVNAVRAKYKPSDRIQEIPKPNGFNDNEIMRTFYFAVEYYKRKRQDMPLMALDLLVWIEAFNRQDLVTPVFDDVIDNIYVWKKGYGIPVYVYSGGPKEVLDLMLSTTDKANILGLVQGTFGGETIGHKEDQETWRKITKSIGIRADQLLFISKRAEDAKVPSRLGVKCIISCKAGIEGMKRANKGQFAIVKDFRDIVFD